MNSSQISRAMLGRNATRGLFRGVFAADQLKNADLTRPCCLVLNTDPSHAPGTHWCAVFIPCKGRMEWFDSYGQSPASYGPYINAWFSGKAYFHRQQRLQGKWSSVCGQYCLYYLTQRCRGVSRHNIYGSFDPRKYEANDKRVHAWVTLEYGIFNPVYNEAHVKRQVAKVMHFALNRLLTME